MLQMWLHLITRISFKTADKIALCEGSPNKVNQQQQTVNLLDANTGHNFINILKPNGTPGKLHSFVFLYFKAYFKITLLVNNCNIQYSMFSLESKALLH